MADRILVLEGGQVVEHGSHNELLKLNGRYAVLYSLAQELLVDTMTSPPITTTESDLLRAAFTCDGATEAAWQRWSAQVDWDGPLGSPRVRTAPPRVRQSAQAGSSGRSAAEV